MKSATCFQQSNRSLDCGKKGERAVDIWAITGIGVVAAAICILVRQYRPEFAMLVSLCSGILLFVMVMLNLTPVLDQMERYVAKASLNNEYFKVLIKSLGICYVASIAGDTCRDAGQTAIAAKIELAAKVAVVVLALPLFGKIVEISLELIAI